MEHVFLLIWEILPILVLGKEGSYQLFGKGSDARFAFLPCSCFSISPTGTIPRALGMICRCLISLFDASKWRGTGGKLSHPGRESFPSLGGKVFPPVPST